MHEMMGLTRQFAAALETIGRKNPRVFKKSNSTLDPSVLYYFEKLANFQ